MKTDIITGHQQCSPAWIRILQHVGADLVLGTMQAKGFSESPMEARITCDGSLPEGHPLSSPIR